MANTRGQQRAAARLRQPKRRLSITSREIELCESLIWFVLATKPQCEIRAEKVIAEMIPGVFVFTPRSTRTIKKPRHRKGERPYREIEVSAYGNCKFRSLGHALPPPCQGCRLYKIAQATRAFPRLR